MSKIDIVSGFLGAGKTSFIQKLIDEALKSEKLVVIENEFGEIGIDGAFLKDSGIEIREMNQGCICCSLVGDFETSLKEVVDTYHPDRIIIEPSGVGKLSDIIGAVKNISENMEVELHAAVTVVDCKKAKMYSRNFGEFFNNQIAFAGTVVLSRTDIADEAKINEAVAIVKGINKNAKVITTPVASLTGAQLMEIISRPDTMEEEMLREAMERVHEHEHHHHHDHDEDEHEHHHDHDEEGHEHHHHDHDEDEHEHHHDHDEEGHEHHHHDHDEDEHAHHHHDHDEDEHEHHHHDHDEEEHGHHHHDHDEEGHGHHHHEHDEEGHEHHHHHDEEEYGEGVRVYRHSHDHHHHHHDEEHDADEIFTSWGLETPHAFSRERLQTLLDEMANSEKYGMVVRCKGMLPSMEDGKWMYFDMVPEQTEIRDGQPSYTGKVVVIGAELKEELLEKAFLS